MIYLNLLYSSLTYLSIIKHGNQDNDTEVLSTVQFLCKKKKRKLANRLPCIHILPVCLGASLYVYNCVVKSFHLDQISYVHIYTKHFCCTLHVKNRFRGTASDTT